MPVKKVILCEGIHDVYLFELLLNQRNIKSRIIKNENLNPERTRERTPETNAIRNFIGTKGTGVSYLLKDEDGNIKCIGNFIILYEDKDERYSIFLCLDDDQKNRKRLREAGEKRFNKLILDPKSDFFYTTIGQPKHAVFFIPKSLESQVREITGKTIDWKNHDQLRSILPEFIETCREKKIDWFMELETVFFQKEYTS